MTSAPGTMAADSQRRENPRSRPIQRSAMSRTPKSANANEKFDVNERAASTEQAAHNFAVDMFRAVFEARPAPGTATTHSSSAVAQLYPRAATRKSNTNGL